MKLKETSELRDDDLRDIIVRNDILEGRRKAGELPDRDIYLVIDGHVVRAHLPAGHVRQTFMAAVGHSLRMDSAMARARLDGRLEGAAKKELELKQAVKPAQRKTRTRAKATTKTNAKAVTA